MASPSSLQNLLRNQIASKIPKFLCQTYALTKIPQIRKPNHTTPFSNPSETEFLESNPSFGADVYSSFPFGYFLGPDSRIPSSQPVMDDEMAPQESNVIRADSVKKKRKKKMNKHKLRKLRKRLSKKT